MTTNEKRDFLVKNVLTRKEKNIYSQKVPNRTMIENGYGDCSGTMLYWYKKLFGIDIGINTEAQLKSGAGRRINVSVICGVPDESVLKKGDLLYFRGSDDSRTEGVGHVEMYIGNGEIFGHGSGVGGTVKNMADYCRKRQNTASTKKLKNKGLICVKRFLEDEQSMIEELTEVNDIVWEFAHRGIITDSNLWLDKLSEDKNAYWLARKALHALRMTESGIR